MKSNHFISLSQFCVRMCGMFAACVKSEASTPSSRPKPVWPQRNGGRTISWWVPTWRATCALKWSWSSPPTLCWREPLTRWTPVGVRYYHTYTVNTYASELNLHVPLKGSQGLQVFGVRFVNMCGSSSLNLQTQLEIILGLSFIPDPLALWSALRPWPRL